MVGGDGGLSTRSEGQTLIVLCSASLSGCGDENMFTQTQRRLSDSLEDKLCFGTSICLDASLFHFYFCHP